MRCLSGREARARERRSGCCAGCSAGCGCVLIRCRGCAETPSPSPPLWPPADAVARPPPPHGISRTRVAQMRSPRCAARRQGCRLPRLLAPGTCWDRRSRGQRFSGACCRLRRCGTPLRGGRSARRSRPRRSERSARPASDTSESPLCQCASWLDLVRAARPPSTFSWRRRRSRGCTVVMVMSREMSVERKRAGLDLQRHSARQQGCSRRESVAAAFDAGPRGCRHSKPRLHASRCSFEI